MVPNNHTSNRMKRSILHLENNCGILGHWKKKHGEFGTQRQVRMSTTYYSGEGVCTPQLGRCSWEYRKRCTSDSRYKWLNLCKLREKSGSKIYNEQTQETGKLDAFYLTMFEMSTCLAKN